MIERVGPYPGYRDSGVPWLGVVPDHWDVKRNKLILGEIDERSSDGMEELLSVSQYTGVRPRRERQATKGGLLTNAASLVGHKRIMPNDLVINIMLAWNGSLGVSPLEGIVSTAYCVFRAKAGVEPRFLHYLFRTPLFTRVFKTVSTGVVDSRLRLYPDVFLRLPTPLPPLAEQVAIVRFLDHADRRIRRYVAAKMRVIALLNEQKRAVILHAVTRGIDPHVRLKPSGVEVLGDVPEHWVISRIKNEFECLNSVRVPLSASERGLMTLRAYDYYGASGVIDRVDDYLFDDDLLLLAEDGANLVLRNLPLAIVARGKFWVNNHAHILRPRRGNVEFLAHLLESHRYDQWISGAAQPKLTQDRLLSVPVAVPARLEQDVIARWIETETRPLNVAISQVGREIELLREYRSRLISDVVTGVLDVREASTRLPDDSDEPELLGDGDLVGDESADETDLDNLAVLAEA